MYKPLSLIVGKTNQDLNPRSLFRAPYYKELAQDKPAKDRQAHTRPIYTERTWPTKPDVQKLSSHQSAAFEESAGIPSRCIKSYRSDRMAIYDEQRDSFHAYSVTEAISQPGLSFQEAVDWVDERLVLVGNGMNPTNFTVAIGLITASWVVAIFLLLAIARVIF